MRIASTGVTGFIGRYIAEHLVGQGHRLRCWRRQDSDCGGLEHLAPSLDWIDGDLGDAASFAPLVQNCDAVVHSALYHPGGTFRGGEADGRASSSGTLSARSASSKRPGRPASADSCSSPPARFTKQFSTTARWTRLIRYGPRATTEPTRRHWKSSCIATAWGRASQSVLCAPPAFTAWPGRRGGANGLPWLRPSPAASR